MVDFMLCKLYLKNLKKFFYIKKKMNIKDVWIR